MSSRQHALMTDIKRKQEAILSCIDGVSSHTVSLLKDQEADLLRSFRVQIRALQLELDAERKRNLTIAGEFIAKAERAEEDASIARDSLDKADAEVFALRKELARAKAALLASETSGSAKTK